MKLIRFILITIALISISCSCENVPVHISTTPIDTNLNGIYIGMTYNALQKLKYKSTLKGSINNNMAILPSYNIYIIRDLLPETNKIDLHFNKDTQKLDAIWIHYNEDKGNLLVGKFKAKYGPPNFENKDGTKNYMWTDSKIIMLLWINAGSVIQSYSIVDYGNPTW